MTRPQSNAASREPASRRRAPDWRHARPADPNRPLEGTPQFFRYEATRARETAERIGNPDIKDQMLLIAAHYDAIARAAERRRQQGADPAIPPFLALGAAQPRTHSRRPSAASSGGGNGSRGGERQR